MIKRILFLIIITASSTAFPDTNSLFDDLKGFGKNTVGGLDGLTYRVTSTEDYLRGDESPVPGTLRWGIEETSGPVWIVFDPDVFPVEVEQAIYLKQSLALRDNVTIDGRGSQVAIKRRYDWSVAEWNEIKEDVYECEIFPHFKSDRSLYGAILKLRSTKNIIISHIKFEQEMQGEERHPGKLKDSQCFGDAIQIYNLALNDNPNSSHQGNSYFDNIWINRSTFSSCKDECVGITRSSTIARSHLTISHNLFQDSYKGILIGNENDIDIGSELKLVVSLYENHFLNIRQRSPRVANAYVHFFNNWVQNWNGYGVAASRSTRVILEQNIFTAMSDPHDPWQMFPGASNGYLWAQNNQFHHVDKPENYTTRSFPKANLNGGPWYYDDQLAKDLTDLSEEEIEQYFLETAGWRHH